MADAGQENVGFELREGRHGQRCGHSGSRLRHPDVVDCVRRHVAAADLGSRVRQHGSVGVGRKRVRRAQRGEEGVALRQPRHAAHHAWLDVVLPGRRSVEVAEHDNDGCLRRVPVLRRRLHLRPHGVDVRDESVDLLQAQLLVLLRRLRLQVRGRNDERDLRAAVLEAQAQVCAALRDLRVTLLLEDCLLVQHRDPVGVVPELQARRQRLLHEHALVPVQAEQREEKVMEMVAFLECHDVGVDGQYLFKQQVAPHAPVAHGVGHCGKAPGRRLLLRLKRRRVARPRRQAFRKHVELHHPHGALRHHVGCLRAPLPRPFVQRPTQGRAGCGHLCRQGRNSVDGSHLGVGALHSAPTHRVAFGEACGCNEVQIL
eukprot:Rhum_TRINITY_DN10644_c0_g1::Rhum_TRINITY_DN10644_c0_g1_i1::g.39449::m.39449